MRKITPDGVVTTLASAPVSAALGPYDVAVDKAGNSYLTLCEGLNRAVGFLQDPVQPIAAIVRVDPSGASTVLDDSSVCASGIAVDAAGNLFVAYDDVVKKITPDGAISIAVGQPGVYGIALGSLPASLAAPTDVSIDAAGNLYIGSDHALLKVQFGE